MWYGFVSAMYASGRYRKLHEMSDREELLRMFSDFSELDREYLIKQARAILADQRSAEQLSEAQRDSPREVPT